MNIKKKSNYRILGVAKTSAEPLINQLQCNAGVQTEDDEEVIITEQVLEHYDRIREIHNPENVNRVTIADRTKLEALGGYTYGRLYAAIQASFIKKRVHNRVITKRVPTFENTTINGSAI